MRSWLQHATGSPLYSHLMDVLAGDDQLMRVLNRIEHKPQPNVLLAGIHALLMQDPAQKLARHYPDLIDDPGPVQQVARPFREFVLEHEAQLVEIGRTRHTQTNEVGRCTALLPAIWETDLRRFHLIDLGASAGLNLAIDRYHYRWDGLEWGPRSRVTLECSLRGRAPAPKEIEVLSRTGLDLNPLDPSDPDDVLWLEALIWPEQTDRRRRLQAAFRMYADVEVDLVAGDAVETLGATLSRLPGDEPVVVMHSFALNQFSPEQRSIVDEQLTAARRQRPLWRVSMELLDWGDEAAKLTLDDGAGSFVVGTAQPHGEWLALGP
ncbi:MAG TPA: DUF2332 domain-containing protein [Acidimicrobiia bacterium]|nr:DUF2332 domain-containing protein [Acidimicrobiia bacterium]